MLRAACHDSDGWRTVDDLSTISDLRADRNRLLWVEADVVDLDGTEIATIAAEFDLPELAVEDAMNPRQRPKAEPYGNLLFIVVHELQEIDGQFEAAQLACFLGDTWVLTIHAGADQTLEETRRRWRHAGAELDHPSLMLHTLIDVVVDHYQELADSLEDEVEELEEIVLAKPDVPIQRQLYSLKQRISRLRRYVLPGSRILDWVVDPDSRKPFSEETGMMFRDISDHLLRMADQIRNIDDLAKAILDLTRSEHAASLNEVNKRLSAWAAIFAVSTLIAGIYGMNFELVPEDQTLIGFWFAIALMAGLGVGLYSFFKKRGWL